MTLDRRHFLAGLGAAAVLAGVPAWAQAAKPTPANSFEAVARHPNIVYVYPDELRPQSLGYFGLEPVKTPRIDQFAAQSLDLRQAVSSYPVCVPYRTMLMSGQYPFGNGVTTNCFQDDRNMKDSVVWLPDVLYGQGYTLGYLGKWHITKPIADFEGRPLKGNPADFVPPEQRHHFDYWYHHTTNSHLHAVGWAGADKKPWEIAKLDKWSAEVDADNAVRYLLNQDGRQRDPAKPFCLFVSMNPPHSPYAQVPERYLKLYRDLDVEAEAARTPNLKPAGQGMGAYGRKQLKNYYACVSGVDEQFGRILDAIRQAGLEEETIVVFTSDHGNCLGRHDEITKNNPYQESFRVPFLVRWPGKIAPRQDDLLISTPDIYPTLLGLVGAGAAIPRQVEGRDLSSLLLGRPGERPAFQPYYFIPNGSEKKRDIRGVRTLEYTLAVNGRDPEMPVQLFDHAADPFELHNLAAEKPEVVAELLQKQLIPWLEKTQDPWLAEAGPRLASLLGLSPKKDSTP